MRHTILVLIILSFSFPVFTQNQSEISLQNKTLIANFYNEILNKKNLNGLKEYVSGSYQEVESANKGIEGFRLKYEQLITAFPDSKWEIKEILSDENGVSVNYIFHGTHIEPYHSIPVTNKIVSVKGCTYFKIKDSQIISSIDLMDGLGLYQQLDIIPSDILKMINPLDSKFIKKRTGK